MEANSDRLSHWCADEFSGAEFKDKRLKKRFSTLVDQFALKAGQSIPLACEDWAAAKAAYRFFDNSKVTQDEIVKSHIDMTRKRAENHIRAEKGTLLVIQDTTFLNYSHHPKTTGLGEISKFSNKLKKGEKLKVHGLILHSGLALTTEGVPLGLLSQKLWTRQKEVGGITKSGINMTRIPIEEKESFRWIQAMREVTAQIQDPSRVVHIGDREADIFEFFDEAKLQETHFLVRIRDHQRCLENGSRIFDPEKKTPTKGSYKLTVKNSAGVSRVATIDVKFYPVNIRPSVAKNNLDPVSAWVITARETSTPPCWRGKSRLETINRFTNNLICTS